MQSSQEQLLIILLILKLDELVTTNTIPLNEKASKCCKIRQLSIAETLANVIRRISDEQSISTIFAE